LRYNEVETELFEMAAEPYRHARTMGCLMKISAASLWLMSGWLMSAVSAASLAPASAQQFRPADVPRSPPFTTTLSNNTPLVFGMDAEDASRALETPLQYVSGGPGDEIFLAFRHVGGNPLLFKRDRLYLQFRQGRLAGWKGDWGHNWMWQ
jgi:hypothetical protein